MGSFSRVGWCGARANCEARCRYMNIALEQTEEYVNGVLTNSYGDAFVRGNNGAWSSFWGGGGWELIELRWMCSSLHLQALMSYRRVVSGRVRWRPDRGRVLRGAAGDEDGGGRAMYQV